MSDDSLQGTGDPIGIIDLGPVGRIVFEDDGHHDSDTKGFFEDHNGDETRWGYSHDLCQLIMRARADLGDDVVADAIADADVGGGGGGGGTTTSWQQSPPAFKCQGGCNQSWPRSKNQNPGGGDDVCPNCDDG